MCNRVGSEGEMDFSVITTVGTQLGILVSGSVVVETIFNINGLGRVMVVALNNRDYTTLQTGLVLLALITCLCNLAVDIAYAYVDPRIMAKYKAKKQRSKKPTAAATQAAIDTGLSQCILLFLTTAF